MKLLDASQRQNVTLQILPEAASKTAGMSGAFAVFPFGVEPNVEAVTVRNAANTTVMESTEYLAVYANVFDELRSAAISQREAQGELNGSSAADRRNGRRGIVTPEIVGVFCKSPYSDQQGDCVEVAHTAIGGRAVRDSKDPACGAQFHTPGAWGAFLGAVKDGHLFTR